MLRNKTKIAVVIPKYGLIGGAEEFAAQLTERIAGNDHFEIHVFANRWQNRSRRIAFHKTPVISFPKFLTTLSFAFFAGRRISAMDFDLTHTHERIFGADLFTMHGIPHRLWVSEVRKKRMSLFDRATAAVEKSLVQNPRCRKFLAVSELARESFRREYPRILPGQVDILHPGVDIRRFPLSGRRENREAALREMGIDPRDFVILFVSMNFEIKGLAELMAALAKLKARRLNRKFTLLVVGRGNSFKFRKIARRWNLETAVRFLGAVPGEMMPRLYFAGDAFAQLSRFDTFGITVLEAMAASLPVVVSANVGARDLVRNGENGFIIADPSAAEEIADRLAFLADEEIRRKMGAQARDIAAGQSWESVAGKVQRIYETLLAS
jgi:UDP-glucose:(heptosyl)LPS alpha-1,3-glucosyltransferase